MAERKSGPVKPPVIDLTARTAAAESNSAAEATTDNGERQDPPRPPRPQARLAMPWSAISIAAAVGALLGVGATYAVATLVPLPDHRPQISDPSARLENQDASISDIEIRLGAVEGQAKRTQISLDATIAQLDAGLTGLRQTIAAAPAGTPIDLTPLEARVKTVEDRIAAIGAGAPSADGSALASSIANLSSALDAIKSDLASQQARLQSQDDALAKAASDIALAKSAISSQNQSMLGRDIGPAVRLPLLVAAIESSFDTGGPFASELAALLKLLPDVTVPDSVNAAAASGLPRPDSVAVQFAAIVPAILSARTATTSKDLWEGTLEWTKALLAFRPTGELDGDTPDAVMSRLEGAVQRRDFVAASGLLDALPQQMRDAAGAAGGDIRTLAAAGQFIADLRSKALAATETAP